MSARKTTGGKLPALRKVEITPSGTPRQYEMGGRATTFVPLAIKRRSSSKLLIPPPGTANARVKPSFDLPIIRMLGKAFYWQRLLDTGEFESARDLARRFKLEAGWVAEVLRMTRLAPDIVQAIVDGRQPRHLTLWAVRGREFDIPLDWRAQRVLFGLAPDTEFES